MLKSLERNHLFFGVMVTVATVAVVGYSYYSSLEAKDDKQFSMSIWTEIYRSLTYTAKEQEILLKFDQFNHAAQLLQNETDKLEKCLRPYLDNVNSESIQSHQYQVFKKQVLELSCDIDHIFGKLDNMDLSSAASLRGQRKQLVDLFAAKAKHIDQFIQKLEMTENQGR